MPEEMVGNGLNLGQSLQNGQNPAQTDGPNPDQIANQNDSNLDQMLNQNGSNLDQMYLNAPNPNELIESGKLGEVPIRLPRKYQDRVIQVGFTDHMIISDEETRQRFFKPKQQPCKCTKCAIDTKCACNKLSKYKIKGGKLVQNKPKLSPWDSPIVPCHKQCKCEGKCGSSPMPINPKRMYISYNEKTHFSLYAAAPISKGEMIGEYLGEVSLEDESENFDYTFSAPIDKYNLGSEERDFALVDASRRGNHTAIANHSCSPSAEPVYYYVQDADDELMHPTIGIFAMRKINPGDEITIHYGMDYWAKRHKNGLHCECGSNLCFEKLGSKAFEEDCNESNDANATNCSVPVPTTDHETEKADVIPMILDEMPNNSVDNDDDSMTTEQQMPENSDEDYSIAAEEQMPENSDEEYSMASEEMPYSDDDDYVLSRFDKMQKKTPKKLSLAPKKIVPTKKPIEKQAAISDTEQEEMIAQVIAELEEEDRIAAAAASTSKKVPNKIDRKISTDSSTNVRGGANQRMKEPKNKQIMQPSELIELDNDSDADSNQIPWASTSKFDQNASSSNHRATITQRAIKQNLLNQTRIGKMKGSKSAKKKHPLNNGGANNDAKRARMGQANYEKGKGKMDEELMTITFEPKMDYLVSETRRAFWLSMEPFGITASQNTDVALKIFTQNLSTINPAIIIKQLNEKFFDDKFVENTQIGKKSAAQTKILFKITIITENPIRLKQTVGKKELLFFYVCLLRRMNIFLDMPNKEKIFFEFYEETVELIQFIGQFITKFRLELTKIHKMDQAGLEETTKFEEKDKLTDAMCVVVYGILVVMAPLMEEKKPFFNEKGQISTIRLKKLEEIVKDNFATLLRKQKIDENIVEMWHKSAESAKQQPYLTVPPRMNAMINFFVAQRNNHSELKMIGKMYKIFFQNLNEYFNAVQAAQTMKDSNSVRNMALDSLNTIFQAINNQLSNE
ncbi:hypothetical protein niasHT_004378 [Heterodera trifolii]|uniref:SET domain-containing protein n=1 Tax=Heterodera trifolii TaxID=157864 RepID=A0ABD2M3P7_9BILA